MEKPKKYRLSIFVYIYIIGVILFLIIGPIRHYRYVDYRTNPEKSCYSNIRVLQGAVEMYNMDNDTMMSTTLNLELLKKGDYIKKIEDFKGEKLPEPYCSYSISGDIRTEGEVLCKYHGTVDNTVPRKDKEEPYASMIAKANFDRALHDFIPNCINRLPVALIWPLYLLMEMIFILKQ